MKKLPASFIAALTGLVILASPVRSETKTLITDSKAVIGPVLELTISQQGQSELKFGNIRPSALGPTEAGTVLMIIDVKANTGERYQVTQVMSGPLENAEGRKLGLEYLKFKTAGSKSNGAGIATPTNVSASAQVIFTSDANGSSDTITAEYTLTVPPSQEPGDYSSLLTYTVSAS